MSIRAWLHFEKMEISAARSHTAKAISPLHDEEEAKDECKADLA